MAEKADAHNVELASGTLRGDGKRFDQSLRKADNDRCQGNNGAVPCLEYSHCSWLESQIVGGRLQTCQENYRACLGNSPPLRLHKRHGSGAQLRLSVFQRWFVSTRLWLALVCTGLLGCIRVIWIIRFSAATATFYSNSFAQRL